MRPTGEVEILRGAASGMASERPKVLVMSHSYPNNMLPLHGLWVERLVQHLKAGCDIKVIAPVQYCPPVPLLPEYYRRFRRIEARSWSEGVEVLHPRFLVGPAMAFYSLEAATYYLGVVRTIDRLRRDFPFDLIHAHFTFPDGAVAARLSRRYSVPYIITEQSPWLPWMARPGLVRESSLWAARRSARVVAISQSVYHEIAELTGAPDKVVVIPDGVDGDAFTPGDSGDSWNPDQILFVGFINYVKGVDVLLRAMERLIQRRPGTRLVIVGGSYYRGKRILEDELRKMVIDLGLTKWVHFAGTMPLPALVQKMRESAVLVLPSRSESFGSVLVEALACGTPVVATRCGGPEDIVTDEVGVLVPKEDPEALAGALEKVLASRGTYSPARLREHALGRFGWDTVARRYVDLFHEILAAKRQPGGEA